MAAVLWSWREFHTTVTHFRWDEGRIALSMISPVFHANPTELMTSKNRVYPFATRSFDGKNVVQPTLKIIGVVIVGQKQVYLVGYHGVLLLFFLLAKWFGQTRGINPPQSSYLLLPKPPKNSWWRFIISKLRQQKTSKNIKVLSNFLTATPHDIRSYWGMINLNMISCAGNMVPVAKLYVQNGTNKIGMAVKVSEISPSTCESPRGFIYMLCGKSQPKPSFSIEKLGWGVHPRSLT